jgi:hypothetical protein
MLACLVQYSKAGILDLQSENHSLPLRKKKKVLKPLLTIFHRGAIAALLLALDRNNGNYILQVTRGERCSIVDYHRFCFNIRRTLL